MRKASSDDLGDLDAWALPSGLYLQAAGPCAVLQIFKRARNGSIRAPTSCTGRNSLLWFNPGTGAEQWLIRAPANQAGVTVVIPFCNREDGNL